jgi:hypothetical protein
LPPVEVPLPQLGQPIADALSGVQLPLPIPVNVDATPEIEPGGTVDYTTGVGFDFGSSVEGLTSTVEAELTAAGLLAILDSLALHVRLTDLTIPFPHPAGTSGTGTPTASGATGATAAHTGGAMVVTVDEWVASTETGLDPIDADVHWSVLDGGTTPPAVLTQRLGPIDFGFDLEIEATIPTELLESFLPDIPIPVELPAELPLVVGATGPWRCDPHDPPPVLAKTKVVAPVVTTTTASTSTSTSTTTTS